MSTLAGDATVVSSAWMMGADNNKTNDGWKVERVVGAVQLVTEELVEAEQQ